MAWHSGKPADNDFLSVSVQHIRENFAELEPLQPHVADLVDLTALQPHVAELVDLTALQPHVAELVDLTALQPHVAELVNLTELQPHIAALLDSRIVEMGSNSNGEYVRWENGLQVTFSTITFTNLAITSSALGWYRNTGDAARFTWPAAFVTGKTPVVIPVPRETDAPLVTVQNGTNQTMCSLLFWRPTSATVTVTADVLAIGWWK